MGLLSNDDIEDIPDTGEQQMYEQVQQYLKTVATARRARALQLLESRYPFGKYAEQAQLS